MKVMQVIGGGEKGGSRNHIITLAKLLRKRGIQVEIVCFLDDTVAKDARENQLPVTILPMKHIGDVRAVRELEDYMEKKKPHLVHTHGVRANFIGRLAARKRNVPVVTTVHSSIYHDYAHPLKKLFYHRIEKLTRPLTDKFIAVADSLKKELVKDKIKANRIEVVYNGLSPDFSYQQEVSPFLRAELNIDQETPIIMTVGRLEEVKNQSMLLEVFSYLNQNGIAFHGVLVGDGPLMNDLKEKAEMLGIENKVSFLGFRKDIYELLSEADLFVLTSKMEGLPITLLESMASRTPVVVTDVGGMPQFVEIARNGYVVPVDDVDQFAARIESIFAQPELRAKLIENGYQALMNHFTADIFVNNTIHVYEQVIADYKIKGKKG